MNTSELNPGGVAISAKDRLLHAIGKLAVFLLVALLCVLAWLVSQGGLYEPGSDFAYNLGLVGSLLMASLLLYALRKRSVAYDRFGKMETWFKYHMMAGILGPVLVLFHSTFKTASMNGAMALYSMLLVALSGVVGRFIYRHIHQGLYGQQLTLAGVNSELTASAENMGSVFALQADIESRLRAFYSEAFDRQGSFVSRVARFLLLRLKGRLLAKAIRHDAKLVLRARHGQLGGGNHELRLSYQLARQQVDRYLDSVIKASQLAVWERLFSFWHVFHIPFLYLLVFSGVVHVVAVHMY